VAVTQGSAATASAARVEWAAKEEEEPLATTATARRAGTKAGTVAASEAPETARVTEAPAGVTAETAETASAAAAAPEAAAAAYRGDKTCPSC